MTQDDRKMYEVLISDTPYYISLLRGLKNYLLREAHESEMRTLFADALGFAVAIATDEGTMEEKPTQKHIDALECLKVLCDRMYVGRTASPIRTFYSHEEYVQALDRAIRDIKAYLG